VHKPEPLLLYAFATIVILQFALNMRCFFFHCHDFLPILKLLPALSDQPSFGPEA